MLRSAGGVLVSQPFRVVSIVIVVALLGSEGLYLLDLKPRGLGARG